MGILADRLPDAQTDDLLTLPTRRYFTMITESAKTDSSPWDALVPGKAAALRLTLVSRFSGATENAAAALFGI